MFLHPKTCFESCCMHKSELHKCQINFCKLAHIKSDNIIGLNMALKLKMVNNYVTFVNWVIICGLA